METPIGERRPDLGRGFRPRGAGRGPPPPLPTTTPSGSTPASATPPTAGQSRRGLLSLRGSSACPVSGVFTTGTSGQRSRKTPSRSLHGVERTGGRVLITDRASGGLHRRPAAHREKVRSRLPAAFDQTLIRTTRHGATFSLPLFFRCSAPRTSVESQRHAPEPGRTGGGRAPSPDGFPRRESSCSRAQLGVTEGWDGSSLRDDRRRNEESPVAFRERRSADNSILRGRTSR
jgi:hypothetical protein